MASVFTIFCRVRDNNLGVWRLCHRRLKEIWCWILALENFFIATDKCFVEDKNTFIA